MRQNSAINFAGKNFSTEFWNELEKFSGEFPSIPCKSSAVNIIWITYSVNIQGWKKITGEHFPLSGKNSSVHLIRQVTHPICKKWKNCSHRCAVFERGGACQYGYYSFHLGLLTISCIPIHFTTQQKKTVCAARFMFCLREW